MTAAVEIDLNVRIEHGWTYSSFGDISGTVPEVGDIVEVRESESGIHGLARVVSLDFDRGLIVLDVAWSQLRAEVEPWLVGGETTRINAGPQVLLNQNFHGFTSPAPSGRPVNYALGHQKDSYGGTLSLHLLDLDAEQEMVTSGA